jgi:hypothetical protein
MRIRVQILTEPPDAADVIMKQILRNSYLIRTHFIMRCPVARAALFLTWNPDILIPMIAAEHIKLAFFDNVAPVGHRYTYPGRSDVPVRTVTVPITVRSGAGEFDKYKV